MIGILIVGFDRNVRLVTRTLLWGLEFGPP